MMIQIGLPYEHQEILLINKDEQDKIETKTVLGVTFVPLIQEKPIDY